MSKRLTTLSDVSVEHSGMTVIMDKTFTHRVQIQVVQKVTTQDMLEVQKNSITSVTFAHGASERN